MKKLHLITQRNQSFGSRRKCCEKCGLSYFNINGYDAYYTDDETQYTKEIAEINDLELCTREH